MTSNLPSSFNSWRGQKSIRQNLFVIGSMRSGTTLLRNILAAHPEIYMNVIDEPGSFADCGSRGIDRIISNREYRDNSDIYLKIFNSQNNCTYNGESSSYYTCMPLINGAADKILEINPDARLLYIIRDPIDRTISHYWHRVVNDGESRSIQHAIMDCSLYRDVSHYVMQLAPFYVRFDRGQIGVYTLEELVNNYEETVASIFRWLEVKPIKIQQGQWINRTPSLVRQRLSSWNAIVRVVRRNNFNRAFIESLPMPIRQRVHQVFTRSVDRGQVDVGSVAGWLRPVQREQTKELSALLGRDFKIWKTLN